MSRYVGYVGRGGIKRLMMSNYANLAQSPTHDESFYYWKSGEITIAN